MITNPIPKHGLMLIAVVWSLWRLAAGPNPLAIVAAHWPISVTMIFGSLVAGSTSEGGGVVAFPVLTKLLHIAPTDAKVFSLAIQSVGMTSATIVIILSRIAVEWRVICWATLGGIPGIVLGSALLAPQLPSDAIKLAFTVMVSSFAIALYLVNRVDRACYEWIPKVGVREKSLLLAAGFLGGILSGLVGSGIDIVCFSLMVLLFRLSVKVATPTSVVLMALSAVVGFCLHYFFIGGFTETVRNYWLAAVPVVVIGAPAGALICARLNNKTIANVLIGLIGIELVSTLWIIPLNERLLLTGASAFICFSFLFYTMHRSNLYSPEPLPADRR
jgi:uncharacterized protein